ncbi:hypothetical protein HLBENOHH_00156 [Aeromonas dhakensis]
MKDVGVHKVLVSACLLGPCSLCYEGPGFSQRGSKA